MILRTILQQAIAVNGGQPQLRVKAAVKTCEWIIPYEASRQRPRITKSSRAVIRKVRGRRSSPESEIHTGTFGGTSIFGGLYHLLRSKGEDIQENWRILQKWRWSVHKLYRYLKRAYHQRKAHFGLAPSPALHSSCPMRIRTQTIENYMPNSVVEWHLITWPSSSQMLTVLLKRGRGKGVNVQG